MMDFPRNGDGADMLHDWWQRQLSWTRTIVFRRDDTLSTSKTLQRRPDNPNGPSKFRKYRVSLTLLRLFTSAQSLLLFHGSGSCHTPAPSYFEEITRCQRKKLDWRWPGNPNGRLKFRNLGLFTFTRSQLTLRRQLRGFWRSLKQHVTDVKNIAGMTRIDRNSANTKIYDYEIKQNVLKNFFFLLRMPPRLTALRTVFFSCFHWQRLLFSHSKNNFSTTLTPPKNRDIHIVEFFCRFYL